MSHKSIAESSRCEEVVLRAHQKDCKQKIKEFFYHEYKSKGLVKMFCGSGKSLVIYDTLLAHGGDLCVAVVPSIHLITQFKRDYLLDETKMRYNEQKYSKEFDILTVCSLDELGDCKDSKDIFTTDEIEITDFLFTEYTQKVVLITYQSLPKFIKIVQENEISIELVCFDEAHHILGMKMKHLLFGYDDSEFDFQENFDEDSLYECTNFLDCVKRSLFFTATPKNSSGVVMYEVPDTVGYMLNDEFDENTEVADEPHCGPMLFEYTHRNGVDDLILNDFKVRVDMYTENTDKCVFEAISRSILETGNSRVLTFHSRSFVSAGEKSNVSTFSKQKKEFLECFQKVCRNEFPELQKKYKKIRFEGMTSKTKNRMKVLHEFDETPDDEIFILSSCRTINEGVDTKRANMVVFVDEKQSFIEITQNIGRVCRKQDKLSTILIPCYVDVAKYANCETDKDRDIVIRQEMAKGGNFNGILNVLSALRQEDPYIFELCLKYPEEYTETEIRSNLKRNGLELLDKEYTPAELFREYSCIYNEKKSEESNFRGLQQVIKKNVQVINNSVLEQDLYLESSECNETEVIYKTETGYKKTRGKTNGVRRIDKPNRNMKINVHTNDEIKVLWKMVSDISIQKKVFGGFIECEVKNLETMEDRFRQRLEQVKEYINVNQKRPSNSDKSPEIKSLASWINNQKRNYEKNDRIMRKPEIRKLWQEFSHEYAEYFLSNTEIWMQILEQVKLYINQKKKTPSQKDKNTEIKILGGWISVQKQNYEKNKKIMRDLEICKLWQEFRHEYAEYFLSNTEIWMQNLEQVKLYINENNETPSNTDKNPEIKSLAMWIGTQKKNYPTNSRIMKDPEIRKLWEQFRQEYAQHFLSNTEIWMQKLEQVKLYINQNKRTPSKGDKNPEIKSLSAWISMQKQKYEKKIEIMKEPQIRKLWEEFTLEYAEYFLSNTEIWMQKLEQVKLYINEHKKRPSESDKNPEIKSLGGWIQTQKKGYQKNENIMIDPEIKALWEQFILEYDKFLLSKKEKWMNKLEQTKSCIIVNKKTPSQGDKNPEIKKLAEWIQNQKQNYVKEKKMMKDPEIRKLWDEFTKEFSIYLFSNTEIWMQNLEQVKEYINQNKKTPSNSDKNPEIKKLAQWIQNQKQNYDNNEQIMRDSEIRKRWEQFTQEYAEYFLSNTEIWMQKLEQVKQYINQNKKRPSESDKNPETKSFAMWIGTQKKNYPKNLRIMKDPEIRKLWEEFTQEYMEKKPARKSTKVKPKRDKESCEAENESEKKKRKLSDYQEIGKKMSTQHSNTTAEMFALNPELWHGYHDERDFSFLGYKEQDQIPVKKIISYLETKKRHKIRIYDLGCGRNLIAAHFQAKTNFQVTGFDHVSCNGSVACDISKLQVPDNSANICVFSQSLMGSNWSDYLSEAKRVLTYNGEIIVAESVERYDVIKNAISELEFTIIREEYSETERWFFICAISNE